MSVLNPPWQKEISISPIQFDQIHIWQIGLDQSEGQINSLIEILSPDELERANRFYFEKDRNRFISGRGMLRVILGRYLGGKPKNLLFEYSNYGKPEFGSESGFQSLKFNLSHSEGIALLAITQNINIGIDVECIRNDISVDSIAKSFFSEEEITSINKQEDELKKNWFFQLWTRKEAFLKATGKGLSFPLRECDTSSMPGKNFSPVVINKEISDWQVKDLIPIPGFAAAIAVEGLNSRLSCIHYSI